jgi:hypothetical protein
MRTFCRVKIEMQAKIFKKNWDAGIFTISSESRGVRALKSSSESSA